MKPTIDYSIYLVTDQQCLHGKSLPEALQEALEGGVTLVQLREKNCDSQAFWEQAVQVKELCDIYNVPLLINDRLDIALAVDAAGVHLGQSDLPLVVARKLLGNHKIIGVSAHNVQEAQEAEAQGADYLGCGAVFVTGTKQDTQEIGLEALLQIKKAVKIPIVGIGGINAANYEAVLTTGVEGAAIVSGILGAADIKAEVQRLQRLAKSYSAK